MNGSQTTDREAEKEQISYDQFCSDCQHIVKTSGELGDKWTIGQRDGIQWLECQEHKAVTVSGNDGDDDRKLTVLASHEVHYSLSYGVPVLFTRFSLMSGELMGYEEVRKRILDTGVTQDMVSMAAHPITGLPWLQVTSSAVCEGYFSFLILRSIRAEHPPRQRPSAISESMMVVTSLILVEADVTM